MAQRSNLKEAAAWLGDQARHLLLRASKAGPKPHGTRPAGERLRFLFTIDTEISMGGALRDPKLSPVGPEQRIWGETAHGRAGIDLFMDVFDDFDMKGVFFFEVCGRNVVEEEALETAARHIVQRGHDVELHVHPEFRVDIEGVRAGDKVKPDSAFHSYEYEAQLELVRDTAARLEAWTGQRASAFRAGGFLADDAGMNAVRDAGVPIDSSYSLWSVQIGGCKFTGPQLNDVCMHPSGLLEVPVTNYRASGPRGGLRQLDLASTNVTEAIAILESLYSAGTRVCTSLTHSFRLIRTTDLQYADAKPDAFNIHRLRAICRFLSDHRDRFEVCTYRDLPLEEWTRTLGPAPAEPFLPSPPTWTSLARLAVQAAKDRGAL